MSLEWTDAKYGIFKSFAIFIAAKIPYGIWDKITSKSLFFKNLNWFWLKNGVKKFLLIHFTPWNSYSPSGKIFLFLIRILGITFGLNRVTLCPKALKSRIKFSKVKGSPHSFSVIGHKSVTKRMLINRPLILLKFLKNHKRNWIFQPKYLINSICCF